MALTLDANITADADVLVVAGTVPDTIKPGFRFRLDDELLTLQGFGADSSIRGEYARQWAAKDRNRWLVNRGIDSVAASHTAGADILAANDAFSSSEDLTPPGPFASGGGGTPDAHATTHEQGGSDEIDVTGLPGAGGAGATVIGPFTIHYNDSDLFNAEMELAPLANGTVVLQAFALVSVPFQGAGPMSSQDLKLSIGIGTAAQGMGVCTVDAYFAERSGDLAFVVTEVQSLVGPVHGAGLVAAAGQFLCADMQNFGDALVQGVADIYALIVTP